MIMMMLVVILKKNKVASLKDPTPVEMELGDVDDNDDAGDDKKDN